nr:zinc finger, CCHC-type [Tanacetum cinerariifolium]
MTTSSANNSVFRGFFEKQKLTGPNFIDWYRKLRIVLSIEDKLNYQEQPIPLALVARECQLVAPKILAAHTAWIKGSKEIDGLIFMTMQSEIQRNLENLHAQEMLQELKTLFAQQAEQWSAYSVEAIGSYHLSFPSGLVIVLNNCHYAPSIARGIISICRLYDDGYVNQFMDNSIQVSRNNIIYFSVVPWDGIFEINLSDSYTNVSSIYALSNKRAKSNLDSALLWHCRLGHISKKRIKKLQHDGIFNSTGLRAFEKCVPCMSGKMARKPYTHQVERAKDLLGLIGTDVRGLFKIVSRQGAS